jgi:hypothetical protein
LRRILEKGPVPPEFWRPSPGSQGFGITFVLKTPLGATRHASAEGIAKSLAAAPAIGWAVSREKTLRLQRTFSMTKLCTKLVRAFSQRSLTPEQKNRLSERLLKTRIFKHKTTHALFFHEARIFKAKNP